MTSTFVAGLVYDGILAPQLLLCPMTGMIFRQCLEDAGMHLLYLPPYSPDFNPIEQVFAKLKALLRRMAPRSFDAICDAIKAILEKFRPNECSNYIRHSGYVQA